VQLAVQVQPRSAATHTPKKKLNTPKKKIKRHWAHRSVAVVFCVIWSTYAELDDEGTKMSLSRLHSTVYVQYFAIKLVYEAGC
jgi:hypothetical protein